ncbi:MFS transporter [Micromonospora cathayae]|uniref:MFS transporter n=1 Tax=Micromonospora cathayae TaxID=3028804 RepID=A0ABY7ZPI1_9ACTN|nr:MFS transporter [Micromonospora sp. HUAS 3]WDZ84921.1 MFS transporter [Micromonospora sp. HUAS 3]
MSTDRQTPMTGPPRPRVTEVLRAPQVSWVLVASLVGRVPLGAAPLALLLFARDTMTISLAGLLVGAYSAGLAVGQPMLARMADRWRQPPVMWAAVALSTAGFVLTAVRPAPALAVLAAVAAGLGAPPFEAGLRVLWKDLVADRLRHAAYTLDVTIQELIFIAGPLLTMVALAVAGPAGGLLVIAAGQVVGTALFTLAPVVRGWRGETAVRHWAGPLRAARLRLLLAVTALVGAAVGATTVAVAGYAEAEGVRSWAGWLLAAQATGALVGGLVSARHTPSDPRRHLRLAVALLAVGYLPLLLVPPPLLMAVGMAVSGLALPTVLTGIFLSADGAAPPGTAAESFAWVATAFALGSAAGSAVDGALLDTVGGVLVGFAPAPLLILGAALLVRVGTRTVQPR